MVKVLKRNSFRLIVAVTIFVLFTSAFASGIQYSGTIITNQGALRSINSFDGEEITTLPIGTKVWIEESKDDWYRITDTAGSNAGWIFKDLVALDNAKTELKRGQITVSTLNVRKVPSTDAAILSKLTKNTKVTIISQENEWYQILLGQVEKGWIHSDFVQVIPNLPEGRITVNSVTMTELKDKNSTTLRNLKLNDIIYIKDFQDSRLNIVLGDFTEGWVEGSAGEISAATSKLVNRSGDRTGVFSELEDITSNYLGKKYSWGQTGPNSFDCSGFTTYIFKTYYSDYLSERGIDLPRTSRDQSTIGTAIDKDSLIAGDLVFFDTTNRIAKTVTHVGIYLGDGRFIHASSSGGNVIISSLDEGYYRPRLLKAVRL